MDINDNYKIQPDEGEYEYIYRVCSMKDAIGTWDDVADILNENLRYEYSSSKYRKCFQSFSKMLSAVKDKVETTNGYLAELKQQKKELEIARIKMRDERTDFQTTIREEARRESFVEIIHRALEDKIAPLGYTASPVIDSDDDMIVVLSDLHTGIECKNQWNKFDDTILRARLNKYLDEIASIQETHHCKVCHVVLGGDNVSGLIHPNLRLQNNENVIEQVKTSAILIGDFIAQLIGGFESIKVHSIAGNHSRISPNKEDHLKGEELDEIITFCLELKFCDNDAVEICKQFSLDNTLVYFYTRGKKLFYVVHGDKDTPVNVLKNLTLMTGTKPDGIIMGHRHHNALDSQHGVKIVQCGSVVGTDDYCIDKRISGSAEQCVIITNENKTVKCMYDVCLQ